MTHARAHRAGKTVSKTVSKMAGTTGLLSLCGLAAVVGCSSSPVFVPSHDFDSPKDVTFACMELSPGNPPVLGSQPMDVCHPPGKNDPLIGAPYADGNTYKTFAFVPNASRGDVSVIDMSTCRNGDTGCLQKSLQSGAELVDLDPNSIGFAAIPVGEDPEVIEASQDGCRVITANRRSCDLTLIDPAALMTPRLLQGALPPTYAKTFMVLTGSGTPLSVAPGEVAFVPQQTALPDASRGPGMLCNDMGTLAAPVGDPPATPDARASWHVLVTFPTCDLIALVDVTSEKILDSYRVSTQDGKSYLYQHTGTEPVCPRIDCGGGAAGLPGAGGAPGDGSDGAGGAGGAAGAGAGGGDSGGGGTGGMATPGNAVPLDVQPLAIRPEGTRVYFGATNAPIVGALDMVGDTLAVPAEGASTALANAGGVMRLRLSVDPYAYTNGYVARPAGDPAKPEFGRFVAQTDATDRQYLYAIGRDASVRIVDVSVPVPTECDVGIDPTAVAPTDPRRKCFPVGASDNPPRLPQIAYMSGLHFGSAPQDIAFAYYWTAPLANSTNAVNEQVLNGAYAFVMTGGGSLYVINVDPQVRSTQQVYLDGSGALQAGEVPEDPLPLPNTPRDANVITYVPGLLQSIGPPRADTSTPIMTTNGPVLRTFSAYTTRENAIIVPLSENNTLVPPTSPVQTYVYFPNRATVLPQTWSITWEGDLTGVRATGDLDLPRTMAIDDPDHLAVALTDSGGSYCSTGIFPGDTVTLNGCTVDSNCSPGRVCVHNPDVAPSASGYPINGLCMRVADSTNKAVLQQCSDLLRTFRRYEISPTFTRFSDRGQPQSTLVIVPKKAEIPRIEVCSSPGSDGNSCTPDGRPDLTGFSCFQGHCLMLCEGKDANGAPTKAPDVCLQRRGSVCVDFTATDGHYFCADGAPLRDAAGFLDKCDLDELVPYSISAGRTFVVAGSSAGRTDPGTSVELKDPSGNGTGMWQCARDPSADPSLVSRIPMTISRCASPQLTKFTAMTSAANSPLQPSEGAYNAVFASSPLPTPDPCFIEFGKTTPLGAGTVMGGAGGAGGIAGSGDGTAGAAGGAGSGGSSGGATGGASGTGGSAGGATTGAAGANGGTGIPTYSALFQNREIRFVLTNLETIVGDPVQIRFTVDGGTVGQVVPVAVDSAVGLPARIKLGPVPATDQTLDFAIPDPSLMVLPSDLPYLFVVDQRNSITGRSATRGQLLRIAPRQSDTSPVPAYQSAVDSNSYFPIQ